MRDRISPLLQPLREAEIPKETLSERRESIDSLSGELSTCRGQVAFIRNQCGVGYPPCWTDSLGKIEYIFTIDYDKERFLVQPTWPAHRGADFRN